VTDPATLASAAAPTATVAFSIAGMGWYIPVLIFAARIADVSIGTVRMIYVINGHRYIAAALGFIEVIIWALAVGGVIKFLTNPAALIAYGLGFAAGTLVGMIIEERLAIGYRMVHIFNREPSNSVAWPLRDLGYRVTTVPGEGLSGAVEIAYVSVKRKAMPALLDAVGDIAPQSFVTIERADRATLAAEIKGQHRVGGSTWRRFSQIRK